MTSRENTLEKHRRYNRSAKGRARYERWRKKNPEKYWVNHYLADSNYRTRMRREAIDAEYPGLLDAQARKRAGHPAPSLASS